MVTKPTETNETKRQAAQVNPNISEDYRICEFYIVNFVNSIFCESSLEFVSKTGTQRADIGLER